MQTQVITPLAVPVLVPIEGWLHLKPRLSMMTAAVWSVAHTALWPRKQFTSQELDEIQQLIKQHLLHADHLDTYFMEMIQRILMTRMYVLNFPGRYVSAPGTWLHPNNGMGYACTAKWFERLQQKRKNDALHYHHLKAFAEAVLELAEEQDAKTFHYWRSWFAERGHQRTCSLFIATAARMF